MRLRFYIASLQLATLGVSMSLTHAQEITPATCGKPLDWSSLAPENGKPFTDPFTKLTDAQLQDLSYVLRVQQLIAARKIKADGRDATEANELASKLQKQGVDIGWLAAQRDRVRQHRSIQVGSVAKSVAESLKDENVCLIGYVIPLKTDNGKLKELLLVPTFAACSHEDPPPSLKVVFISLDSGILTPEKRHPIRVTGKISARSRVTKVVNGNGRVTLHSAYAMKDPMIEIAPRPVGSQPAM